MKLDCSLDLSACLRIVFDFSKADFHGLREHFAIYNDWTTD